MEKLLLDGKWELHYAPEHAGKTTAQAVKEDPAYTHIEANVPGNAELDLYAAGKAPEPFWGTNLYAFRPYEFYEWWYTRTFVAPQALADYIRIIREEHTKRTGGMDPLAAAMETYKDKKGYGGKRT